MLKISQIISAKSSCIVNEASEKKLINIKEESA